VAMTIGEIELKTLVRDGWTHRRIYTDPTIFELEMEKIFHRTWIFVGHDSQVPNPGDFYCTTIGKQPVVMVRHTDGKVRVIYNRCGHRGAKVVNEPVGNAKRFICPYHAWTYETNGKLRVVPMRNAYPADIDLDDRKFDMRPVPRCDGYHGFIFASLTEDGPDLLSYFGSARQAIDDLIARAPDSEVQFIGGVQKYEFRGNWKLQTENLCDQYHTSFTHVSSASPDGYQYKRRAGDEGARTRILTDKGDVVMHDAGVWAYDNAHNAIGAMHFDSEQSGPVFDRYRQALVERHGVERTKDILKLKRHNGFFYPSMDIHHMGQFIRVFRPIAVDRTQVLAFPMYLKGAPIELYEDVIRVMNLSHSAAALAQTDDLEVFERCQMGLAAENEDWTMFMRGHGMDTYDPVLNARYGPNTSELPMRAQHQVWLQMMSGK
jgi:benzoate/toluate 1,2-dioxygenase alpha subunit